MLQHEIYKFKFALGWLLLSFFAPLVTSEIQTEDSSVYAQGVAVGAGTPFRGELSIIADRLAGLAYEESLPTDHLGIMNW